MASACEADWSQRLPGEPAQVSGRSMLSPHPRGELVGIHHRYTQCLRQGSLLTLSRPSSPRDLRQLCHLGGEGVRLRGVAGYCRCTARLTPGTVSLRGRTKNNRGLARLSVGLETMHEMWCLMMSVGPYWPSSMTRATDARYNSSVNAVLNIRLEWMRRSGSGAGESLAHVLCGSWRCVTVLFRIILHESLMLPPSALCSGVDRRTHST